MILFALRYLEDYLPSLSYRAPLSKGPRKRDEDEQDAQAQYISGGLSEQHALAIQSIMRSDRLDYEVIRSIDSVNIVLTPIICSS